MFNFRKLTISLAFIPFLMLSSCGSAEDPYKDHIKVNDSSFVVNTDNIKKEYNDGELLDLTNISVKLNGNEISTQADEPKVNCYFVTRSQSTPSLSLVKKENFKLSCNSSSADMTFYIGTLGGEDLYISDGITIKVNNPNALKPWVWYVVSGVVIFGVIGMVTFTRRKKAKMMNKDPK